MVLGSWHSPRGIAAEIVRNTALPALSELELRRRSQELRAVARERSLAAAEIRTAFGLVRESARRTLGTPHFAVQLQAGWMLQAGGGIEMETGEGKTLTALLAAYVLALPGMGCHVLTANDYLAERDALHAREILSPLGMTVDWIGQNSRPEQRRAAYLADVTFVTVTQVGFDLLRDRVSRAITSPPGEKPAVVQRPLHAAVIDEADLVMLDEARTPLLLAVAEPIPPWQARDCDWAATLAAGLQVSTDFQLSFQAKSAQLTEAGCRKVLLSPVNMSGPVRSAERSYRLVERALEAIHLYARDQDYLLRDGKVAIIGPTTGRVLDGRQWQNGLQPAIEWKEGTEFSPRTRSNGAITIQSLLNLYPKRCGMSGTLWQDRQELRAVYGVNVQRIPPRLPCLRRRWQPRCFESIEAKLAAIATEIECLRRAGRPVLVGTPSIETSEQLSRLLTEHGLVHELLTAREPRREAEIVQRAGKPGQVTIATNMAGRGTDIRIADAVRPLGGLHVIVAGLQASARTDRQLVGRTARQGDPGTYQEFLSYDDELLQQWNPDQAARWQRQAVGNRQGELSSWLRGRFRRVQRELEGLHRRHRMERFREQQSTERWCQAQGLDPFREWLTEDRAA